MNILLGLEIIKHFWDYTDEELVEQFFFNIQIKWALGIRDIGECPIAERTLYEFRERLYRHALIHPGEEDLVFQQFQRITRHFIEALRLSTEEMRMDSTQLMSNIRRAGRLSLAFDVLRQAVWACPVELLSEQLAEVLKSGFKSKLLYQAKSREIPGRFHELRQLCAELIGIAAQHEQLSQQEPIILAARFLSSSRRFTPAKVPGTTRFLSKSVIGSQWISN